MASMDTNEVINLTHGSGGQAMNQLIDELFVTAFDNKWLRQKNDQATLPTPEGKLVISTDSFVVSPLFFPGGNIGSLAVNGTINDVAMAGATPLYLTVGLIIEEGFPIKDLSTIVYSMAEAAKAAKVEIVTGDTKVVERGKGDGLYINTTGVGTVSPEIQISADQACPGDLILVSGTLGDHGIAVMSKRNNLSFDTDLQSDCAALHDLVSTMIKEVKNIHCLRDPTRGGLASNLNEIATQSKVGMTLIEKNIPIAPEVAAACEILGLDPLYIANEGKLIAICPEKDAEHLLSIMKSHPLGINAAIIGSVVEDSNCFVQMETVLGGKRMIPWLSGEPLPRIC